MGLSNSEKHSFKNIKASDLFVKALEHEGVEYIFGIPGEENLDILESIRNSKIKLILTRHEQAAGFMAATYGRLTGRVGVCLSTLGPGATNFVTAAAYAKLGGMPMMMITGQKPIKKSKQGQFQIVDVISMMRPITKFTHQIVNAYKIPCNVREAFRLAEEERPGPVHLELPEDVAAEIAPEAYLYYNSHADRPLVSPRALKKAVAMIKAAERPLILIGAGANRNRIAKALLDFVEKTEIPVFSTQMGKGVLSNAHPAYIGTAALSDKDYVHCAVDKADLIINIGHDVIEKPPFFMTHGGKQVIHLNFFTAITDEVYFPQLEMVGDIATTIEDLTQLCSREAQHDFSYFIKVRDFIRTQIEKDSTSAAYPMIPQRIVADVRSVMPEDGIIALDNGMYKIWFARNYTAYKPNTVLLDNALATMGAGLPSAMMASMLYPDRRVLCICGDSGFMMNSQELETAVRLKLNLVIMIINDNALGMIRWKQTTAGFADFGLRTGNPDFSLYAQSYGADGVRINAAEELVPTLERCFEQGGIHLIEVPIDYSENIRVLSEELKGNSCVF